MKYTIIFLFALINLTFSSCSIMKDGKPTIKQGVFGQVLWLQGNVMPSPDIKKTGSGAPARRAVNIYQLTNIKETTGQSPLFDQVKSVLIASVKTNAEGYFQCELPPGKYSVFTVERDNKFFANLFEGDGSITPFEVKEGQVTNYSIQINYKAFY